MPAYLNLSRKAWLQLRRAWTIPSSAALRFQTLGVGSLLSGLEHLQNAWTGDKRERQPLDHPVVILGFWRSGTTLLHELLSCGSHFASPTTYDCMNPHHFMLTRDVALEGRGHEIKRPMDDMVLRRNLPQEDEFALLSLGARSPYEGLIVPNRFADALQLADPDELEPEEARFWEKTFLEFCRGVSAVNGGKPLLLKSPPHGYRVHVIRRLLGKAKFIVIARDPYQVFESTVRTWRQLSHLYGLTELPPEDETRWLVLRERMRYEAKLQEGLAGLPASEVRIISYETLRDNPLGAIEAIFSDLQLGDFQSLQPALSAELDRRAGYKAHNAVPPVAWRHRVSQMWSDVFDRYSYSKDS
jgi:hypothetical protein